MSYYRVQVNAIFTTANQQFLPGQVYYVTDTIYNGKLDGQSTVNFKDMCSSAVQQDNAP